MQRSQRMQMRRLRPPSVVMISQMRGEVEVRWVRELRRDRGKTDMHVREGTYEKG